MVNPVKAFSYFLIYNLFFIFILSSLGFLTTRNGADHPRTTPASAADTAQGSFLFFNVNMEQSPHVLLITPSTLATSEKEKYRHTHKTKLFGALASISALCVVRNFLFHFVTDAPGALNFFPYKKKKFILNQLHPRREFAYEIVVVAAPSYYKEILLLHHPC